MALANSRVVAPTKPTVFIGLGRTGGMILCKLRRRFRERYGNLRNFPIISFLQIDTDQEEIGRLSSISDPVVRFGKSELFSATIPDTAKITEDLYHYPGVEEWWHPGLSSLSEVTQGTKGQRPYGRLAFFCNYEGIKQAISAAIGRVTDVSVMPTMLALDDFQVGKIDNGTIDVIIVSSVAGGTGSGMFLDVSFLVKSLGSTTASISAYLVLPDAMECKKAQPAAPLASNIDYNLELMQANGFAFLKELDHYQSGNYNYEALWDGSSVSSVTLPPADYIYLYDGHNVNDLSCSDLDSVCKMVSDTIFQRFLPGALKDVICSTTVNLSAELQSFWNMKLPTFSQFFVRRYLSSGLGSISMPNERLVLACAYRLASQFVSGLAYDSSNALSDEGANLLAKSCLGELKLSLAANSSASSAVWGSELYLSLMDEAMRAEPAGSALLASGLLLQLKKQGLNIKQAIAKQVAFGDTDLNSITQAVAKVTEQLEKKGDSFQLWGDYPRIIHANRQKLLDRLLGHYREDGQIGLKDWLLDQVYQGKISLGAVRKVLQAISKKLKDLLSACQACCAEAGAKYESQHCQYEACLSELKQALAPNFVLSWLRKQNCFNFLNKKKIALCEKTIAASFGLYKEEGFLAYALRLAVGQEYQAIIGSLISYIEVEAQALGTGITSCGLIEELSVSREEVAEFLDYLNSQANILSVDTSSGMSISLYRQEDFEGIYKRYIRDQDCLQKCLSDLSKSIFGQDKRGLPYLRQALRDNTFSQWESLLVKEAKKPFATLPQDYHVLKIMRTQYGNKAFEHLACALKVSGYWAKGLASGGDAYSPKSNQVLSFCSMPVAADEPDEIGFRNQLVNYVRASDPAYQIVDSTDTGEIVFYQALGGFPISFLASLSQMRQAYKKKLAEDVRLHMHRNYFIYRDPALLDKEEAIALLTSRRAAVLGIALGIILESNQSYYFVDQSVSVFLGSAQVLNSILWARKNVCHSIIEAVDNRQEELLASNDANAISQWYAFVCQLVVDNWGEHRGSAQLDCLDFEQAMAVQLLDKEKDSIQTTIIARYGDYYFKEILEYSKMILSLVAKAEQRYSETEFSNPFPKRQTDHLRVFPNHLQQLVKPQLLASDDSVDKNITKDKSDNRADNIADSNNNSNNKESKKNIETTNAITEIVGTQLQDNALLSEAEQENDDFGSLFGADEVKSKKEGFDDYKPYEQQVSKVPIQEPGKNDTDTSTAEPTESQDTFEDLFS